MGTPLCDDTIRQWMDDQQLRRRKIAKVLPGGSSVDRDAQFLMISQLINQYKSAGEPYFSVDTYAYLQSTLAAQLTGKPAQKLL